MSKQLIINADDYGHCREVNTAVEELAIAGKLGGVSVLANGNCWEQAVSFSCSHPELSAGVHLNAVEGRPVSDSSRIKILTGEDGSFVSLAVLLKRWLFHPAEVLPAIEKEWRAQIERLIRAGVKLTHADSHRHLHAFPPAYRCAVKLCLEYCVPALSWPWPSDKGAWIKRPTGLAALQCALVVSSLIVPQARLFRNDQILGFQRSGAYGVAELMEALRRVPPGVTVLAVHPSVRDGQPYSQLRGNRERAALLDKNLLGLITDLGIEIISWEQLTRPRPCEVIVQL